MTKTTKDIIHDECVISIKQKDGRSKAMIHYIEINPETKDNVWSSQSDLKQLRQELKEELDKRATLVQRYSDSTTERNIGVIAMWRDYKKDIDSVFAKYIKED